MSNQFSKLSKSSKSSEYGTPIELFQKLNKIFNFQLDPATTEDNPLGTGIYFTKEHDGLSYPWNRNVFCNPPFGSRNGNNIKNWINKMMEESNNYNKSYVYTMLLPARTDTRYFQELIWKKGSVIYFIKGRLKFVNPILNSKSEPHIIGSMLWIRNASDEQINQLKQTIPGVLMKYGSN